MKLEKKGGLDRIIASPTIILCFLLVFICIAYSNSFDSPLVLDDRVSFVEDSKVYVSDFSLDSLEQLSSTRFGTARLFPLITFALDHWLGQGSIAQFHLTNLIIHLLATIALFSFLQGVLRTPKGKSALVFIAPHHFCIFVTALWALHPVQTNAVTYLVQRMTSMAAMFYFTSLAFYVHARFAKAGLIQYFLFAGCLFSAICAFMSKENSATLPIVIILVEWLFISPDLGKKIMASLKLWHVILLAIIALLLLPGFLQFWNETTSSYSLRPFTLLERLLTELRIVVFYLSLLALPLPGRMNLDHDFPVSSSLVSSPMTLLSLFLIIGLLVWGWRVRKAHPMFALGVFWFFLNLVIESTVVPLELVFEHRLYLPSVGFFLVIVALLDQASAYVSRYESKELRKIIFLGVLIASVSLSLLTIMRNHVWQDSASLYGDCARKSPDKPRALNNYGITFAKAGNYQKALVLFDEAIAKGRPRNEEYLRTAINILTVFYKLEKYDEVIRRGEEYLDNISAESKAEDLPRLLNVIGLSYMKADRYEEALKALSMGVKMKINGSTAGFLLNAMEFTLREAMSHGKASKDLGLTDGLTDVYWIMANYMMQIRKYGIAKGYIDKALSLGPEKEPLLFMQDNYEHEVERNRLAEQLSDISNDQGYKSNKFFKVYMDSVNFILVEYPSLLRLAGIILDKAEELEPSDPFVAVYKARLNMKKGYDDSALKILEDYICNDSNFPPILELAGSCYLRLGKPDKAALVYEHLLEIYPGHKNWQSYEQVIRKNS